MRSFYPHARPRFARRPAARCRGRRGTAAREGMGPDDQKETELSAYEKRERKIDDARFLAGVRDIVAYIAFLVLYTIVIQTTGIENAFPMASKM